MCIVECHGFLRCFEVIKQEGSCDPVMEQINTKCYSVIQLFFPYNPWNIVYSPLTIQTKRSIQKVLADFALLAAERCVRWPYLSDGDGNGFRAMVSSRIRALFALTVVAACTSLFRMPFPVWQGSIIAFVQMLDATAMPEQKQRQRHVMVTHAGKKIRIMQELRMPFQFEFHVCNGLTNQRIQLLDGALAGLFLGAQIVMPKTIMLNGAQFVSVTDQNLQPLDHIFNMTRFEIMIQQLQLG